MNQTVEGVYDGAVFRPDAALALEPNTRVRLTVEILPPAEAAPPSFLRTAPPWNCTARRIGPRTSTATFMATAINTILCDCRLPPADS